MRNVCYRTVARRIEEQGGECKGQNCQEHLAILPESKVDWFLNYLRDRDWEPVSRSTHEWPDGRVRYYFQARPCRILDGQGNVNLQEAAGS